MAKHESQIAYDLAEELSIPNEFIYNITISSGIIQFQIKSGASFAARLTKTGKVKKGSVRIDG